MFICEHLTNGWGFTNWKQWPSKVICVCEKKSFTFNFHMFDIVIICCMFLFCFSKVFVSVFIYWVGNYYIFSIVLVFFLYNMTQQIVPTAYDDTHCIDLKTTPTLPIKSYLKSHNPLRFSITKSFIGQSTAHCSFCCQWTVTAVKCHCNSSKLYSKYHHSGSLWFSRMNWTHSGFSLRWPS